MEPQNRKNHRAQTKQAAENQKWLLSLQYRLKQWHISLSSRFWATCLPCFPPRLMQNAALLATYINGGEQTELLEKREPKPSLSPQGFHPLPGAPRSKTYSSPVPAPQPVCRSAGSHFLGDEHRDVHTGSNWQNWGIFGWKSLSRMAFSTQLISQCLPVLSSSFYCKVPPSPLSCCKLL